MGGNYICWVTEDMVAAMYTALREAEKARVAAAKKGGA